MLELLFNIKGSIKIGCTVIDNTSHLSFSNVLIYLYYFFALNRISVYFLIKQKNKGSSVSYIVHRYVHNNVHM